MEYEAYQERLLRTNAEQGYAVACKRGCKDSERFQEVDSMERRTKFWSSLKDRCVKRIIIMFFGNRKTHCNDVIMSSGHSEVNFRTIFAISSRRV